jgi:glyoxylase-like metal-dependent hydrolase (beta-lactamase superfamily II)
MKIHHLDCGSMCTINRRWALGSSDRVMPCHCLLIETDSAGLVLVDTGMGLSDVRLGMKKNCKSLFFDWLARPRRIEAECAINRVQALGYAPSDVRHILLTHLDLDHAGGLSDFPAATVHVMRREMEASLAGADPMRYCAAQIAHEVCWRPHDVTQADWLGFSGVVNPEGLPPEILMVPLAGHSVGHAAIAVRQQQGWLLHAGDAYYHRGQIKADEARCPLVLRLFEWFGQFDGKLRVKNQQRLRELVASHPEVTVFCAHDPVELSRCRSARSLVRMTQSSPKR